MRSCFFLQKRKIAKKLCNSEILKVHFHSFRHWKATTEYHETHDLIHVQEMLGHKNIEVTRGYIYIEKALYKKTESDQFHIKVTAEQTEIMKLMETGFEFVFQDQKTAYRTLERGDKKQWITVKIMGLFHTRYI